MPHMLIGDFRYTAAVVEGSIAGEKIMIAARYPSDSQAPRCDLEPVPPDEFPSAIIRAVTEKFPGSHYAQSLDQNRDLVQTYIVSNL